MYYRLCLNCVIKFEPLIPFYFVLLIPLKGYPIYLYLPFMFTEEQICSQRMKFVLPMELFVPSFWFFFYFSFFFQTLQGPNFWVEKELSCFNLLLPFAKLFLGVIVKLVQQQITCNTSMDSLSPLWFLHDVGNQNPQNPSILSLWRCVDCFLHHVKNEGACLVSLHNS